ncbi:hypothetical protein CRYUN_Cryun16bG0112200 [Craigia yunnanensis]
MGYDLNVAALSSTLFNSGQKCGACFEIKCINSPEWYKRGQPFLIVTAIDHCPPNYDLPSDNGGWCNAPRVHFDLAKPAYLQIAEYKGNPYVNLVQVSNVGGAGNVISVQVKGDDKLRWTKMTRNWGQKWQTDAMLVGEDLTSRVPS